MNCDSARAAFLSGAMSQGERDHLDACSDCLDERDALEASLLVLRDSALWEEPPSGLDHRVVALISGAPETAAPSGSRIRWWVLGGGAAAAALIALVVWVSQPSAASDWEVNLPGTSEAPDAWGVVRGWNEVGGTRVALDLQGLPPASDGSVYQLWFSKGELHVSAGTFVSPESVQLWTAVSRAEFPRLWITLEPLDADESPSDANVMDTGWIAPG